MEEGEKSRRKKWGGVQGKGVKKGEREPPASPARGL